MIERPILMNGAMVRATLDGTKTQTRRIVKSQPPAGHVWVGWCASSTHRADEGKAVWAVDDGALMRDVHRVACPYGQPGDRLWVRESYADIGCRLTFRADVDDGAHCKVRKWTPSIHMFRADSRILLEIVSVRVERLQDISDADIQNEGIDMDALAEAQDRYDVVCGGTGAAGRATLRTAWRDLWESTGGDWDANPWLWAISFKRVTP